MQMGSLMLPLASFLILFRPCSVNVYFLPKELTAMTRRFNLLQAHCQGSCVRVILYMHDSTHSSLNILALVCVCAANTHAQLPLGHRSRGFFSADDLLMWIPVRQKGKCLCFQVFLVSRVTTAVTLSPFCPSLLALNATQYLPACHLQAL